MFYGVRPIVVTALITSILSSCATMPNGTTDGVGDPEREIFIQAVATGTLVGGAIGAAVGSAMANKHRTQGALLGGALGAAIGAIAGRIVAEQQLQNLHDAQFNNQRLNALLNTAEKRNREVATYNRKLKREITGLKGKKSQITVALNDAKQERQRVQHTIAVRQDLAPKLVPKQRAQYEQKLRYLQQQDRQLEGSIKRLERMEQGVVG